jgi:hypothetical protein
LRTPMGVRTLVRLPCLDPRQMTRTQAICRAFASQRKIPMVPSYHSVALPSFHLIMRWRRRAKLYGDPTGTSAS